MLSINCISNVIKIIIKFKSVSAVEMYCCIYVAAFCGGSVGPPTCAVKTRKHQFDIKLNHRITTLLS